MDESGFSKVIAKAMRDPDNWVVKIRYEDSAGEITDRFVSPIKWNNSTSFLALCLSRESPRSFHKQSIHMIRLVPAHEVQMPVPIVLVRGSPCLTST